MSNKENLVVDIQRAQQTLLRAEERLLEAERRRDEIFGWWCAQLDKHRMDLADETTALDIEIRELRKALGKDK